MASGSFELTYQVRDAFFDRPAIQRRLDAGRRRALEKSGAWIRTRARSLLRRRKRTSRPGEPPSVHTDPGLKTVLFFWDARTETVVVGPVKLNKVVHGDLVGMRVTTLMEFGGIVQIHESRRVQPWRPESYVWRRRDLRRRQTEGQENRIRQAVYGPRPFMGPALQQTLPTLPQSCKDMLSPGGGSVYAA